MADKSNPENICINPPANIVAPPDQTSAPIHNLNTSESSTSTVDNPATDIVTTVGASTTVKESPSNIINSTTSESSNELVTGVDANSDAAVTQIVPYITKIVTVKSYGPTSNTGLLLAVAIVPSIVVAVVILIALAVYLCKKKERKNKNAIGENGRGIPLPLRKADGHQPPVRHQQNGGPSHHMAAGDNNNNPGHTRADVHPIDKIELADQQHGYRLSPNDSLPHDASARPLASIGHHNAGTSEGASQADNSSLLHSSGSVSTDNMYRPQQFFHDPVPSNMSAPPSPCKTTEEANPHVRRLAPVVEAVLDKKGCVVHQIASRHMADSSISRKSNDVGTVPPEGAAQADKSASSDSSSSVSTDNMYRPQQFFHDPVPSNMSAPPSKYKSSEESEPRPRRKPKRKCKTSKPHQKSSQQLTSKATSTSNLYCNPPEHHPLHSLPPNFRNGGPIATSESDVKYPIRETCEDRHRSRFEPGEDQGLNDRDCIVGTSSPESGIDEGNSIIVEFPSGNSTDEVVQHMDMPDLNHLSGNSSSSSTLTNGTVCGSETERMVKSLTDPPAAGSLQAVGPSDQAAGFTNPSEDDIPTGALGNLSGYQLADDQRFEDTIAVFIPRRIPFENYQMFLQHLLQHPQNSLPLIGGFGPANRAQIINFVQGVLIQWWKNQESADIGPVLEALKASGNEGLRDAITKKFCKLV
ncbi:uncharacterized protein [Amphiura filiformis]|uniref:uncharacterized protein n=1 Tax=Amphiura filiformis TaxID=82378 RepID=UPI003B212BEC